jgi:hypothetical protein
LRVELEVKSQPDKDRTHTSSEIGGSEKQFKNKWDVELKVDETITIIEVGRKKKAEAQAEIGAVKAAIFIKISISKSANLTIELETLTDRATSITAAKKKKSSSSTTVIEVGGEM